MTVVAFSPEAQMHLDRYLRQIRAALRAHSSIDAVEVERDVLSHIDTELAGQAEPVAAGRLLQVLERLGPPDQWVPDDSAGWRRTADALWSGPGEWRLALLTIVLFVAGPALFLSPRMLWPLPPLLLAISFLLARLTLALFEEHREPIDARRWLIYPALVPWYGAFLVGLFGGPPTFAAIFLSNEETAQAALIAWAGEPAAWRLAVMLSLVIGAWWVILGFGLARLTGATHAIFSPFADWFERRHGTRIAVAGLVVSAASAVLLIILRRLQ